MWSSSSVIDDDYPRSASAYENTLPLFFVRYSAGTKTVFLDTIRQTFERFNNEIFADVLMETLSIPKISIQFPLYIFDTIPETDYMSAPMTGPPFFDYV